MLRKLLQTLRCLPLMGMFLLISFNLFAEEVPRFKFGKIGKEELKIKTCDIDTSANAFILFDVGNSTIQYSTNTGFQIVFNRHYAIKILTKSGYNYASFKIPIYKSTTESMEEKVTKIKAVTYNLEGGKVKESSLSKKDIYKEKTNENWSKVSFTMPNVVEGSVIEVEYSMTSDFLWNLPTWQFQHDIPVKWSILETRIPEYFNYSKEMRGYIPLAIHETGSRTQTINFTNMYRYSNGGFSGVSHEVVNNKVSFIMHEEIFASKNIPAFKNEAYIDAVENYTSAITFELLSINFPNEPVRTFTTTWEKVCEDLMDNSTFGDQLKAVKDAKKVVEELKLNDLSDIDKSFKIFNYVKNATKWDGRTTKYCDNVKQVFKTGIGSSGDVNIMLINILNAAELNVFPVVLKTRAEGKLPFTHPSLSSLDYVVAAIKNGDKTILLDATEDEIPYNFLPERCLNEKGILIKNNKTIEWLDFSKMDYSKYLSYAELNILEDGQIKAMLDYKRNGHFAYDRRKKLDTDKEKTIKNFEEKNAGIMVDDYEVKNFDLPEKELEERIEGTINEQVVLAGDMMYFSPCFLEKYDENPFKLENRKYPVDFAHPWEHRIVHTITIPENWKIESIPDNIIFALAGDGGRFIYNIQQMGNKLIFNESFTISKSIFLPEQYKALKEFFKQIVDKQQEQVVLKKI